MTFQIHIEDKSVWFILNMYLKCESLLTNCKELLKVASRLYFVTHHVMLSDCSPATMTLWKRLLTSMPRWPSTSYVPIQLHHGMIIIVTWWRLKHGGLNVHIVLTSPTDSLECFTPPSMRSTLDIGQMPSTQTLATRMLFGQKSTRCLTCRIYVCDLITQRGWFC